MGERVVLAGLLAASLFLAGCGGGAGQGSSSEGRASCDLEKPPLFEKGTLTVATDKPAYPPWFKGDPQSYGGYEGEVAGEVAKRMDLPLEWVVEPFNKSYAPGAKDYDFDINQITITPERQRVVDFSDGYFDNTQGVMVLKDSSEADARSVADLKDARIGVQIGTTALTFVNETVQPDEQPKVYDNSNDVKSALESGQVDAIVTDLVQTVYLRDFEIDGSEVVGQYPAKEEFGMLFEKGNPLVGCVNEVLGKMERDGTLKDLRDEHLQQYLEVPTLEQ